MAWGMVTVEHSARRVKQVEGGNGEGRVRGGTGVEGGGGGGCTKVQHLP